MALGHRSDASLLASDGPVDFGTFYDRHLRAVTAYVAGRVRQPEVRFDVVAETFARALEKRGHYDPARGPAIAWLLGIARHLIADAARRGRVEATSRARLGMEPVELDDEQLGAIAQYSGDDLQAALSATPGVQRDAVVRHIMFGQSYEVIAEDLATSEQVIRKRVSRGLASLRARLEEEQ
jgi:RNA polymerase sigma-70 factor (ECF subfamily)